MSPAEYIEPLHVNGMCGRMLYLSPTKNNKREILVIYGHHSSLERWWGLVQNFNVKLGRVNQLVALIRALASPSARIDVFMIFWHWLYSYNVFTWTTSDCCCYWIKGFDKFVVSFEIFSFDNKIFLIMLNRHTIYWSCCTTIFIQRKDCCRNSERSSYICWWITTCIF